MRTILAAGVCVLGVCIAAGCAAPGQGPPADSASATDTSSEETISPSAPTTEPTATEAPSSAATDISPSSALPSAPPKQPGAEKWPPVLAVGDIKEAGTVEVLLGSLRLQLPAGFVPSATVENAYVSSVPERAGAATITLTEVPNVGDAAKTLSSSGAVARVGEVDIRGAVSAAVGDAHAEGQQTWVLVVVDASGKAVQASFTAAVEDFEFYLLYQSLCSAQVA